ncbi:MAG: bifunctional 4-hydroxy-2-oxoglutarate aldolase/2-dehydro-3-deoxy-phosphogluconate aldolase [Candidatus Omnitrophica bacterium]|nr:bifunctional 4-hydroxy-2-oxoglutarate aldolase/2-dehydro-3-deoxy-phosphogluconate aldolase [Candidatus Omnitrophota bacterium]MBU1868955.1 bifunctional 4-hydroxy-2-oxoglutarate aldolase/2-dehydro-3-deoxy-phosphogluconate aldolase [Candidatus Omnitrophota bacterium]
MDVKNFKSLPLLGILRGIEFEHVAPLMEAVISSGLETIEITMNTKDAPLLIKEAVRAANGRLTIGAGTVLDTKTLNEAIEAGATFIVMPVLVSEVAKYCFKNKIPFFPGALTPQEIYSCWNAGASMVKVFPAGLFGAKYFKEVKAPFNDIELLACGGVTYENLRDYFANGASAASFGASVFKKEWLEKNDFGSIAESIKKFVLAAKGPLK